MNTAHTLHYDSPASEWSNALPLGCGDLGALVFAKTDTEEILLNNDTFWAGLPIKNDFSRNGVFVGAARELIDKGDYESANALVEKYMLGEAVEPYLPLGYMRVELSHTSPTAYKRALELSEALYTCDYTDRGTAYHREGFVSNPHKTFFQRFEANKKELSLRVSLFSEICSFSCLEDGYLKLKGYAPIHSAGRSDRNLKTVYDNSPNAVCNRFEIWLAVKSDGDISMSDDGITVTNASFAEIYQTSDTSFIDQRSMPTKDPSVACRERLRKAISDGYGKAKETHIADHRALYCRSELTLPKSENSALTTDKRLERFNAEGGESDAELCSLYYHYGRYLMIASERRGTMPGNLQGIWNWDRKPIWECDMHLNINLQMNYWCAENTNLSECRMSLLEFLKDLCESGKKTARQLHSCRGSCAYSTTDVWCQTTPTSGCAVWAYWPMGEAWLAMDIFDHYEYTGDLDFLAEYYGVLKENALFLYDWTYFDESTGYYVTSPSTSPEHEFCCGEENGEKKYAAVSKASACDMSIAREIFSDFIKASELLGKDSELAKQIRERAKKLFPHSIDQNGALNEWFRDLEPYHLGHRHVSHLISVYPGGLINEKDTPELFRAARRSLELRLDNGGGNTGWSCAWAALLCAKFKDAKRAAECVKRLLRDSTAPNLLDLHPPFIFQIDGNFGMTAAIAELLVQSGNGEIELLPCLPEFMRSGSVFGLRAKGGVTVDIEWKDGTLVSAVLTPDRDGEYTVRYGNKTTLINAKADVSVKLS